jgi:hypothetical protein
MTIAHLNDGAPAVASSPGNQEDGAARLVRWARAILDDISAGAARSSSDETAGATLPSQGP